MPLGFHGFSFDLFGVARRVPSSTETLREQDQTKRADGKQAVAEIESNGFSYWKLAAFSII